MRCDLTLIEFNELLVQMMFLQLMAAGSSYFCRHKSNQKGFQRKGFFAALGLCPANQLKPRAAILCPTAFAPATSSQSLLMPFPALVAIIVLPDLIRSWSADREKQLITIL
jgi:hypothetical protein